MQARNHKVNLIYTRLLRISNELNEVIDLLNHEDDREFSLALKVARANTRLIVGLAEVRSKLERDSRGLTLGDVLPGGSE
jgi:hypothetical protein